MCLYIIKMTMIKCRECLLTREEEGREGVGTIGNLGGISAETRQVETFRAASLGIRGSVRMFCFLSSLLIAPISLIQHVSMNEGSRSEPTPPTHLPKSPSSHRATLTHPPTTQHSIHYPSLPIESHNIIRNHSALLFVNLHSNRKTRTRHIAPLQLLIVHPLLIWMRKRLPRLLDCQESASCFFVAWMSWRCLSTKVRC